jgi:hypothetical protein
MLERLSWSMVIFIFVFLVAANVLFVPAEIWLRTAVGFVSPGFLPANMDWVLLGVFAATAGSGGLGNLAVSNLVRDKGLGMAHWSGSIGGMLSDDATEVRPIGQVFEVTSGSLQRWRTWWKYLLVDQSVLWALGCVAGMFLNVNLAQAIVSPGDVPADNAAGAFQARYMAEKMWSGFWFLALLNGFWILFSTQLGNTDCLTRICTDTLWAGWPAVRRQRARRVYFLLLMLFAVWGVIALASGDSALSLFRILGLLASPILAVGAIQILVVNMSFLPAQLRPPLWRRVCLILCGLVYGTLAIVSLTAEYRKWTQPPKQAPTAEVTNGAPVQSPAGSTK